VKWRKWSVSRGSIRGGEGDHAGGFGARPLLGGPAGAGIGVEIVRVDLRRGAAPGAQPAIGARERQDGGEIGIGIAGDARGEEHAGPRRAAIALDQVEEAVELGGDQPRGLMRRLAGFGVGEAVEPGEHGGGEAVVVAVAGDGLAVGPGDGFDLPVDRAGEQGVGDLLAREEVGGAPAERERRACRAPAQRIGRGRRHADDAAGRADGVPLGDRLKERALAIRRPAVVARRAVGGRRQPGGGGLHVHVVLLPHENKTGPSTYAKTGSVGKCFFLVRRGGFLAGGALFARALGPERHLRPGGFGAFAAGAHVGERGGLGGGVLGGGAGAVEGGIVGHWSSLGGERRRRGSAPPGRPLTPPAGG